MKLRWMTVVMGLAVWLAAPATAQSQRRPDPAALQVAQRNALAKLAFMDGEWRGEAWSLSPSGEKHTLTQTERVGPFLDGEVRVIEGRGYEADGQLGFHAFGIVSYEASKGTYTFRSYAQGYSGDFRMNVTDDGFEWEIQAGPATMKYVATFKNGVWHEVGHRRVGDGEPVKFFEMSLERIGDTEWPAAGAVPPGGGDEAGDE